MASHPVNDAFTTWKTSCLGLGSDFDSEALRALEAELRRYARAVCWETLGRLDKDLVQKCVIRVIQHLPDFEGNSMFSTWVYRVFKNECYQHIRVLERRARREEEPLLEGVATAPDVFSGVDATLDIRKLLPKLPVDSIRLIRLQLAGFEDEEIAEILGISISAAKARWYKLRKKLKYFLSKRPALRRKTPYTLPL